MEQFTIPLTAFDVTLLPNDVRDPASPHFREAVADFFRGQIRELGANGVVTVTSDHISVGWLTPSFDPVAAGIAILQRGQLREGAQLLEVTRSRLPDSPDLLFNLGVARSELGELDRAIDILTHLLELQPDHVHGLVALGVALGRSKRLAEALEPLSKAVEVAPGDPWAQRNLGGILYRLDRTTEARPHLDTAVQLAPKDAQAWLLLGEICSVLGDFDAARGALTRARTLDPHGSTRDRADAILNRLANAELGYTGQGVSSETLAAMKWAVRKLQSLSPQAASELTLKAALIGQHGLRLTDLDQVHRLDGIAKSLTALEVACLIHAGVRQVSKDAETGFPLEGAYQMAASRLESE